MSVPGVRRLSEASAFTMQERMAVFMGARAPAAASLRVREAERVRAAEFAAVLGKLNRLPEAGKVGRARACVCYIEGAAGGAHTRAARAGAAGRAARV